MRLLKASPLICLMLLSTFLPSIGHSAEMQEPQNIYFAHSAPGALQDVYDPPEKLMVAWNMTKQLPEMSDFASYGNSSVLVTSLVYGVEERGPSECDYLVIASTLQMDSQGLIHQLIVRFRRNYEERIWSNITHIETRIDTQNFNPVSVADAGRITQERLSGWSEPELYTSLYYPFVAFRCFTPDRLLPPSRITTVVNLLTGKIVVISETKEGVPWCPLSPNPYINPPSNGLIINKQAIILLVYAAFDSKPSDANWNVILDVNMDNTVDIYDAIAFAKNR